ncbi:MAG: asparaginase domain-containing protein [Gammaproteobacteria bacterium]|nr:asparaginase domain-containing protein [Gammaproteobacteria bacterium]
MKPKEDASATILVLTTGGTFDKIYFDAKSTFEVGSSIVGRLLEQGQVKTPYEIIELMRKDSLDIDAADRVRIRDLIEESRFSRVVITHGTDTMTDTATAFTGLEGKTIVLTGALAPARFAETDAIFNLGMAFAAVQTLPPGVYIAMNGTVFDAARVRKDRSVNAFVGTE